MTVRTGCSIHLALDVTGCGQFREAGIMQGPSPRFAAALQAYLSDLEPEYRDLALYRTALSVAGRVAIDEPQTAFVLSACLEASLVLEWLVIIPGSGVLQALYEIAVFRESGNDPGNFELALRLCGKPDFQTAKPETLGERI
jgi:hypothetical protein